MDQKFIEVINDLKSYLEYLQGMGIQSLPASGMEINNPSPSQMTTLDEVRKELGDCKRCKLHRTRKTIVFGGNEKTKLMFIGKARGTAKTFRKAFCGKAGSSDKDPSIDQPSKKRFTSLTSSNVRPAKSKSRA
jgi:DNA polymerase